MTPVIIAMLICTVLAGSVVGVVVVAARRAGRDVLTPRGEEVIESIRERVPTRS